MLLVGHNASEAEPGVSEFLESKIEILRPTCSGFHLVGALFITLTLFLYKKLGLDYLLCKFSEVDTDTYADTWCSVDLRRLVEQNKPNFIPPTSRMTNYVVLRFGNEKPDPCVSYYTNLLDSDTFFQLF